MNVWVRLMAIIRGTPPHVPDPAKADLNQRQLDIAGRLARMKGVTRDEVLAEAYRRADRIVANRR